MIVPAGFTLVPPQRYHAALKALYATTAGLSCVSAAVAVFYLRHTRLYAAKNRHFLLGGLASVGVSHALISLGSLRALGQTVPGAACDAEGTVITLFGTAALLYASCVGVNALDQWVFSSDPARHHEGWFHVFVWAGAVCMLIYGASRGDNAFYPLWSGWCFLNGDRRIIFMAIVVCIVAVNVLTALVVVRRIHLVLGARVTAAAAPAATPGGGGGGTPSTQQASDASPAPGAALPRDESEYALAADYGALERAGSPAVTHSATTTSGCDNGGDDDGGGSGAARELRMIVLVVLTLGCAFVFHAALYINEWADRTTPVLSLFFLDAALSYSSGFLILLALVLGAEQRADFAGIMRHRVLCERWRSADYVRIN